MSPENLDLVRSTYAGWETGDFSSTEWPHPEIEFSFTDGPEPGRWTGLEAISEHYAEWLRGWKDFRAEPERYLVVDDARILVLVRNRARGRTSGVELDRRSVANLFEVHGGKVTRLALYWDRQRALADVGLQENPDE
jgi:ketosteroid isomerase-like protein